MTEGSAESVSADPSNALIAAIAGIAAKPPITPVTDDDSRIDQSGRLLGPRALRTRKKILEATVEILGEKSMRDLRVIDIARRIGSSPATFYQYFKDVNDVVLELAMEVSDFTPDMIELIHGDWTGQAGYERGVRLANLVIEYWDQYRPILRVRNNAADEGDPAFMEVRRKAMFPMVNAFAEVIRKSQGTNAASDGVDPGAEDAAWQRSPVHPYSGGMFLFTLLESIAIHHEIFSKRFGPLGEERAQIVESVATLLQSTLTTPR
jgi:AcrR family transcriptional regulator